MFNECARGPRERRALRNAALVKRGLALAAGAIATLGHAPFFLAPLFVIAVIVLVRLLDAAALGRKPVAAAFGLAWWFGLGYFASGLHWLSAAFLYDFGGWGLVFGACAVFALSAFLACFWGAGCALAMTLWTPDFRRVPVFAAAVACSEWLRGIAFTGFPWLLPGYVWPPGEPISQAASLIGIYGLTALTLMIAAAPVVLFDRTATRVAHLGSIFAPAFVLAALWGWGSLRLAESAPFALRQPIVRVADAGLSQADKWAERSDQEWRVLRRYLEASGSVSEADIVIWPEGAIPSMNSYTLENVSMLEAIGAAMGERTLVLGLTRRASLGERVVHYNSAVIIDSNNGAPNVHDIYDKHRLVPFGEYIPFWRVFSGFNVAPLQRIGTGFEPGAAGTRRVFVANAPAAAILICYEAIFPGLIPRGVERPGWIISLTNDAWFGAGAGPSQHFVMARYRSIETGLPMARAASGGASAIVDANGRVVAGNEGAGFAQARLPAALSETMYSRLGVGIVAPLIVLLLLTRLVQVRRAGRTGPRQMRVGND